LGSLGGTSALLFHSAADFNLYIPANALVFAVLLGMGYAMSLDESASGEAQLFTRAEDVSARQTNPSRLSKVPEEENVEVGIMGSRSS
jgi:hypothetical protein